MNKSLGQITFEKWAEEFEARPIWYDLPYHIKQKWEEVARETVDGHIAKMADDLVSETPSDPGKIRLVIPTERIKYTGTGYC